MHEQERQPKLPGGTEKLKPGDPVQIGAYELIGKLGEGGMGAVYLGRGEDKRLVAIKVIRPELAADQTYRARFRGEVRNAQRVASFCTATVVGHGEEDGRPYLVTEYVDGKPLDEYIETQGALPPGTLHGVAVGVAAALTAIHSAGLIHRDLKPSNVMLSVSGPRVIDFGIARATDAPGQHTQAGLVMGSPGWMAPEQVMDGEVGTAVDVFAWATLVALAGTGRHPYGTGTVMAMAARAQNNKPKLDGLPDELLPLVTKALDPDPARRPSAQQLLLSLVGGTDPASEPRDAQAAADRELNRTWVAEALPPAVIPPLWIPPSPPHGIPVASHHYTPPPAPFPPHHTPPPHRTPPPYQTLPPHHTPPPYHPGPPPVMPPAYTGPRQPHRRPRRGWRGCLVVCAVLAVAVIAGLALIGGLTRPGDGRIGEDAVDGQFTFLVQSPVKCGKDAAIRGVTSTESKLCSVRFSVSNTGNRARTLVPDDQELVDAADGTEKGAKLLQGGSSKAKEVSPQLLPPGGKFSGTLLFDVPSSFQPAAVILHDDSLSNGVRVPAS
ncbi:MAG TPA: serine/threonine-protein kinase [Actinomadura sp.]|nr:serine/threonine-protein kinase [Actinomadura sp.]